MVGPADATVGVYVHVPFCDRVCPYCDFAVVAARPLSPADEERYVDALVRELAARQPLLKGRGLASVYLGGGTPSLLRPASVARVVASVRAAFPAVHAADDVDGEPEVTLDGEPEVTLDGESEVTFDGEPEVTLEVNPSTLERERLPGFADAGVNRLSIGIQSFDDDVLRRLGRAHRGDEGRRTLEAARVAGFQNISLDLLFGGPGATQRRLERDLREVVAFTPEHVSAYELSVEEGTPFALAQARGQLDLPGEADSLEMHEAVESALESAGLARYEISSYARPGREARHNRRYWERRPVLGLGMGAWSTDPATPATPHGSRRANARALGAYFERIESGQPADVEHEVLPTESSRGEAIFLGLRCTQGFSADAFCREFGAPPRRFFGSLIDELVCSELLRESPEGDLCLTPGGRIISDSIFERFV